MEHRPLGATGIRVSPLCLGTMNFGSWFNADHDDGIRIIQRALDAGINFIDTADIYSTGEAEEIVGKALQGRREHVVLATKAHHTMGDDVNQRGSSRRWITRAVEDSLRRLGTDWIDLYQVHRPDPLTDIDETLGVLSDLVRAGKVRAIGCSNFPAHQIVASQWAAERRGRERFRCCQSCYSMMARWVEGAVLPVCEEYGMGAIAYSPLDGGWLSGRYRHGREPEPSPRQTSESEFYDRSRAVNQRKLDAIEQLVEVAEEADLTLIELALGFVLSHSAITAAIIGPRTMEQLESQLEVPERLDDAILDRIDAILEPGINVEPDLAETGYVPPAISQARLRRRR